MSRIALAVAWLRTAMTGSRMVYIVVRYIAAVVVAAEALLFARLLGPSSYGQYAIIAQIAVLLTFVTLGSNAGYVYAHYRRTEPALDDYYVAGAAVQFIAGTAVVAVCFAYLRPHFLFGVLLFLIQTPYLLTEPMLRVRNYYSITALGRGLPALIAVALAGSYLSLRSGPPSLHMDVRPALTIMIIGNLIGYVVYYAVIIRKGYLRFDPITTIRTLRLPTTWANYWRHVLVPGLPLNASTILIVIFQNVDRLFIEHYRPPSALSVYSLGWQLSQGALLMLTSMNLVSGVRVGERMGGTGPEIRAELLRQFRLTLVAAVLAVSALVGGTILLSQTVYRDYVQLLPITLLVSVGYVAIYVVGSITGLMFYNGRAKELTLGYFAVVVSSFLGNVAAIHWNTWYGVPVAFSSLSLIVLNVWFAIYTYRLARRLPHSSALAQTA